MTSESVGLATGRANITQSTPKHLPIGKAMEMVEAADEDISSAISLTNEYFPHVRELAPAIRRVHRHSRSLLVVRTDDGPAGAAALLCLNKEGFARLLADNFSVREPDLAWLAQPGEAVAAIYVWVLCVPGISGPALGGLTSWLEHPDRIRANLYACAGSDAGERYMIKTGFKPVGSVLCGRSLWTYRRKVNAAAAAEA